MSVAETGNLSGLGSLDDLPRTRLISGVTPIEEMPNLSAATGNAQLLVKRDDMTGLAFGGNKVRQLEFYFGQAQAEGADTILITGAIQSNFVRLAAAAARKCGMTCHIQLEHRVPTNSHVYRVSGNVLLDKILGATLYEYPEGEDEAGADARLGEIAEGLQAKGRTPFIIHLAPGHAPLGALGYVDAAREILAQCGEMGIELDEICVGSGSGHTHGGLLFGLRALGSDIRVTGVCVRRDIGQQKPRIYKRCGEIAELLGSDQPVSEEDVVLTDDHLAPGYGRASEAVLDAMRLAAETEGLITDPVYTAKVMAGLIDRARDAEKNRTILFLHTGGTPSIFGYEPELSAVFGNS